MPKFTIHCDLAKPYTLTVEAPSLDAVLSYHNGPHLDEDEFSGWGEGSWNLVEVEPLREDDNTTATLKLNSSGEPIEGEEE
tara:strand:- start:142 stop:384 length:243 start_codon:yes stop_codon:yes gene_type:complete